MLKQIVAAAVAAVMMGSAGAASVTLASLAGQSLFSPLSVKTDAGRQHVEWSNNGSNQQLATPGDAVPGQVQIEFVLSQASDVQFVIEADLPGHNDDSFFYKLDAGAWMTQNNQATSGWASVPVASFRGLAAGRHVLRILRREDGARLRSVSLTPSAGSLSIPDAAGSQSSSSQAASSSSSQAAASSSSAAALVQVTNPLIWADVPDMAVVRVGNAYYMSSTTMHMNPGVPIMKSTDLVNWTLVSYAHQALDANDARLNLASGQSAYGKGSWASSIRYQDGMFYVSTFSYTTNKTYIYKTRDIENGPWTTSVINGAYHDCSLFFDAGRAFLVYGTDDIKIIELTADASAIKSGGLNQVLIPKSSAVAGSSFIVSAEGAQIQKINGRYYVSLISWPSGKSRTQLIYRADSLTGPYTGRVALQDQGVAQGGLVDTPDGRWFALLFRDSGAVGRIPYLVPVSWQDGWPVMGVSGKVPQSLSLYVAAQSLGGIVGSDEFNQGQNKLPLLWQWNHNPVSSGWSLSARPGYLRLTTTHVTPGLLGARNSLTQRVFGPQSSASVAIETANMKDGDYAGLAALQAKYGFVGVSRSANAQAIVMISAATGTAQELARVPLTQTRVYLRVDADFRNQVDQAKFYYSLDGKTWLAIGSTLKMTYDLSHFMGYRFALFNYASKAAGGHADFDYFLIGL